jgi:hypothetical protein
MSGLSAEAIEVSATAGRVTPFEQRLFDLSPMGVVPTALAIFVLFMGSFEVFAALANYPLGHQIPPNPREAAWPAVVLSLMAAVALGMQRYARIKDIEDAPALMRLLRWDPWGMFAIEPATMVRLRLATVAGLMCGAAATLVALPIAVLHDFPLVFLWFALAMGCVGALFARGSVLTKVGGRYFARCIDSNLHIDLLRIDELSVIGRTTARTALIWFSVAAVICLFFAAGHAPLLVVGTVAVSAGMGLWIFFKPLERIHRRIRDAKRGELDHLRKEIAEVRVRAVHDHTAAAQLHGLLSYETRIAAVHEWPFDQVTLLRVGAYVLIPAIPWFGEALVNYFVERMAH